MSELVVWSLSHLKVLRVSQRWMLQPFPYLVFSLVSYLGFMYLFTLIFRVALEHRTMPPLKPHIRNAARWVIAHIQWDGVMEHVLT